MATKEAERDLEKKRRLEKARDDADEREDEDERDEDEGDEDEDDDAEVAAKGADDSKADKVLVATPDAEARKAAPGAGAGSFFRNTWTITRREVRSYFDSLIAYVVVGLSMLGVGIVFFLPGGFWQADRATMVRMFDPTPPNYGLLPWMICGLVIPLITMRAISEEKRSGTIELLITLPVRDSEVILGKYFAALLMVVILFVASFIYPLAMFKFPWNLGAVDWGPIFASYFGLFLMACAGVAVGMLFSSVTESQIISFFLTAATLLLLMGMGNIAENVTGWVGEALGFISFQSRFVPFARGIVDTRAIVYFISIAVICLLFSFRSLESRKWS